MEQAAILRKHHFSSVMILPCGDPRDARGLELSQNVRKQMLASLTRDGRKGPNPPSDVLLKR